MFRYYYEVIEPGTEDKYTNTFMTSWWTEHNNGEHDVPSCNASDTGVSTCTGTYTITSNFTAGDMCGNGCTFITMEGHCHIGCIGEF